ncbi:MAG: hypothetical protein LBI39_00375 [Puniceicoccales bacterium]|nr:hypothetical protein [Puniceicoccales bacterium]
MAFENRAEKRLRSLSYLLWAIFIYLASGLFYRQLIQHGRFSELGQRQSHRCVLKPAPRGNIYDRNGKLLAGNRPRFMLVVYLQELRDEFAIAYGERTRRLRANGQKFSPEEERSFSRIDVLESHLAPIKHLLDCEVSFDRKAVDRHFRQTPLLPFPIVYDLSLESFANLVEQLPTDGIIQLETRSSRYYPNGAVAAHVVGYASPSPLPTCDNVATARSYRTFSERSLVGRAGVESAMDSILRGVNGEEILLVDPSGRKKMVLRSSAVVGGKDVHLSIDLGLQIAAEEALGDEMGCAVLSDVWTGEVLAMANSPSYDLNALTPTISNKTYDTLTAIGAWSNQAIQGLYPLGSVFKLVSVEALLRFGIVDGETKHRCDGMTKVGNRTIRCPNHMERGMLPFVLAVAKSCNSFVVDNIFSIPLENYLGEIRRLGFGSPTGIELPHETRHSLVPSPSWKKNRGYGRWTSGDTANLSIGQGYLLATPLQVNAFTASLAARRERTKPTILCSDSAEIILSLSPLGLSDSSYGALLNGMVDCVERGSGRRCKMRSVTVAGKTGTAQVRDGQHSSHLAWFTAFAPAECPRVAVTVMVRERYDGRSYGGGSDAAPIAKKILEKYFETCGRSDSSGK